MTAEHGSSLAPIEASTTVPVDLPTQFPTVADVTLSTLTGTGGVATGDVVISGPADAGASGEVCFPEEFAPDLDATRPGGLMGVHADERGCVTVASGETVSVPMEARNDVAANAAVEAAFRFTSADASGTELDLSVPVRFPTEKPFNPAAFGGLVPLLVLVGILLPLPLLWLLNYVTARIVHGGNLTRAEFPVTIGSAGIVGRGVDLASTAIGTDEFRFQPNTAGAREFSDRALGRLRARTPWWPLAGRGSRSSRLGRARVRRRMPDPRRSARPRWSPDAGPRSAATSAGSGRSPCPRAGSPRTDPRDASDDGVPGTLVVYTRTDATNPNVFTDRMREVAMSFTAARARVTTAKDVLAAEQREKRENDARRASAGGGEERRAGCRRSIRGAAVRAATRRCRRRRRGAARPDPLRLRARRSRPAAPRSARARRPEHAAPAPTASAATGLGSGDEPPPLPTRR